MGKESSSSNAPVAERQMRNTIAPHATYQNAKEPKNLLKEKGLCVRNAIEHLELKLAWDNMKDWPTQPWEMLRE